MSDTSIPDVMSLAEPTRRTNLGFQLLFGAANLVVGLCNLTIYQALLPSQIALLDPVNKVTILALISAVGALGAVIINPLAGACSDRTTWRFGRRRLWIILGIAVVVGALVFLANATGIIQLVIGGILLQIGINIVLAALTAVIPDQVPVSQRATVSAFAGMAPLVGGVVGLILIAQVVRGTQAAYYTLTVISVVFLVVFLLVLRETPLPREAMPTWRFKTFLADFWVPLKSSDFVSTFLARILAFMGYTSTVMYTFFYLQDAVHIPNVTQGVALFQTIVVGTLLVTSIVGGIVSDRLQRRKPFVIGASLVMMVALLLLAFFPIWSVVLVAAGILGLGFGTYLSVDLALASQVLPTARDRGKDLGIINTAIFIPLIFSPGLAAITIDAFHGYTAFFIVAALCTVLAAVLILRIKSVR